MCLIARCRLYVSNSNKLISSSGRMHLITSNQAPCSGRDAIQLVPFLISKKLHVFCHFGRVAERLPWSVPKSLWGERRKVKHQLRGLEESIDRVTLSALGFGLTRLSLCSSPRSPDNKPIRTLSYTSYQTIEVMQSRNQNQVHSRRVSSVTSRLLSKP